MDNLQLPHAKLLYYVQELFKQKEIDNQAKLVLKEMIISDEPKVFKLLDSYQMNQSNQGLKNGLIQLVYPEMANKTSEKDDENQKDQEDAESEYSDDNFLEEQAKIEDPTSPLGNQLFKKKRQRPGGVQHYKGMLQPIQNSKV